MMEWVGGSTAPREQASLINMRTCEASPLLMDGEPIVDVWGVVVSSQGWYALETEEGIRIVTPEGEEMASIPDAEYPVWSRDGEWLAYTTASDVAMIRQDGAGQQIVAGDFCGRLGRISAPSWSPDGAWLADSCDGVIYRIGIGTGEVIRIHDGGWSPAWRWPAEE